MSDPNKVVTLENLGTFKSEMDKSVDKKVQEAGGSGTQVEYATESDILGLFAETPSEEGGEEPTEQEGE